MLPHAWLMLNNFAEYWISVGVEVMELLEPNKFSYLQTYKTA